MTKTTIILVVLVLIVVQALIPAIWDLMFSIGIAAASGYLGYIIGRATTTT
jgi:hypothetical protein